MVRDVCVCCCSPFHTALLSSSSLPAFQYLTFNGVQRVTWPAFPYSLRPQTASRIASPESTKNSPGMGVGKHPCVIAPLWWIQEVCCELLDELTYVRKWDILPCLNRRPWGREYGRSRAPSGRGRWFSYPTCRAFLTKSLIDCFHSSNRPKISSLQEHGIGKFETKMSQGLLLYRMNPHFNVGRFGDWGHTDLMDRESISAFPRKAPQKLMQTRSPQFEPSLASDRVLPNRIRSYKKCNLPRV